MLPEVILLAQTDHVILGDADLLRPDVVSLVILLINRDVQAVSGNLEFLGQELPRPGNDFLLEVILEAEVAQHLKEAAMAGRDADTLNIRGADALLASGHAMTGRLLLSEEPLLHGGHAAVDQQQAGVVLRHQGEAVQTQVALALEEAQVLFTQFIQTGPLHRFFSPRFVLGVLHVRFMIMADGAGRAKNKKQPSSQKGTKTVCKSYSVVPPKLQRIMCPLPLSAH